MVTKIILSLVQVIIMWTVNIKSPLAVLCYTEICSFAMVADVTTGGSPPSCSNVGVSSDTVTHKNVVLWNRFPKTI
jgi:hypothetical protein